MSTHRVLYNVAGQTLRHVLPERVQSVDYAIEATQESLGSAARTLASGAATVLAVSLTTDAAAGADQLDNCKVPVSATTGATIGAELVIVGPDGRFEAFTVDGVVSADYLLASAPLAGEYASGSAVYGLDVTAPVPAALYEDEDALEQAKPYRVVWSYSTAAGARKVAEKIEFDRQSPAGFDVGGALALLRKGYGSLAQRVPDGQDLRAWADYCVADLLTRLAVYGDRTQRLILGDTGRRLLVTRLLKHFGEHGLAPGALDVVAWAARAAADFDAAFAAFVVGEAGTDVVKHTILDQTGPGPDRTYRGPVLAP